VQDHAEGFTAAARFVAAAIVEIEGKHVRVGLTQERKAGVAAGTLLRVKYSYGVGSGSIVVDDWSLEEAK
jgi:hypothetical protein